MARAPLELGTWGRVWVSPVGPARKGKATSYRARAMYRDFDGVTREVVAKARTRSAAEASLLTKLRQRAAARHGGSLKSTDRFSVAAELWFDQINEMVEDGRRSPGTRETYRRKLDSHVLPALADVRLAEISTPLVDSVIQSVKKRVGPPTAKLTRTVISGVLSLAVRNGAISANPVRDVGSIPARPKRRPRALDEEERTAWFAMLAADPRAVAADLPDLTAFLLATGVRIGEALGLLWAEVDLGVGEVEITHQVTRIKGEGLVRIGTKSVAGERVLKVPSSCLAMLERRWAEGVRPDEPVFCDALGNFRDPNNVRRDLRQARSPFGSRARGQLGVALAQARRSTRRSRSDVAEALAWPKTRIELIESGRVRLDDDQVLTLIDLYKLRGSSRAEIVTLAQEAAEPSEADALAWITSHSFRKTTATILDDAGQSARQIADQLGHARPSLTQDVYMGRRSKNPAAAAALDAAIENDVRDSKSDHFPDQSRDPRVAPETDTSPDLQ
ncbi:Phage integrase family protein [Pedococcus dokdonensis]|uniref:Phage integrase family protein n=2 Tax=Pedococcus dokdonensis TaxID=443156 RepID=A0A1H0QK10_9MICO|nr:Phage integrase family protein [Pedococcus dokdonensis]